jgi:hypothetical protein
MIRQINTFRINGKALLVISAMGVGNLINVVHEHPAVRIASARVVFVSPRNFTIAYRAVMLRSEHLLQARCYSWGGNGDKQHLSDHSTLQRKFFLGAKKKQIEKSGKKRRRSNSDSTARQCAKLVVWLVAWGFWGRAPPNCGGTPPKKNKSRSA